MVNLYIIAEERPKPIVIEKIFQLYEEYSGNSFKIIGEVSIIPIIENNIHTFVYDVLNVDIEGIDEIKLSIGKGNSSFFDFLVFEQEDFPTGNDDIDNLVLMVEETKTTDKESRNTGVYQRSSKFVYADFFYKDVPKVMLYNVSFDTEESPSNSNIFGSNLLMTQNVRICGKDKKYFNKFNSVDEVVNFKNNMKLPNNGVPIRFNCYDDKIEISGRLNKNGTISHDPNIGCLTSIAKTLRKLGWDKRIIITEHQISQEYVDNMKGNKFVYIASKLNIELDGINLGSWELPNNYWTFENKGEKLGTIFLHLLAITQNNIECIYENHASSERGYFNGKELVSIKKVDENNKKIAIPDLILKNEEANEILIIEGKKSENVEKGFKELKNYDSIENIYIIPSFPKYNISRWVVTFGKECDERVLFHLFSNGTFYINNNAPYWIKKLFEEV